jgi:hypothetical protein
VAFEGHAGVRRPEQRCGFVAVELVLLVYFIDATPDCGGEDNLLGQVARWDENEVLILTIC